jgi:small subunit ribosomal protein S1
LYLETQNSTFAPASKGGQIDLTEENKELEGQEPSQNPAETQDVSAEVTQPITSEKEEAITSSSEDLTETNSETEETEVVEEQPKEEAVAEAEVVEEPAEEEAISETDETEVVEEQPEAEPVKETEETEVVEETKVVEASDSPEEKVEESVAEDDKSKSSDDEEDDEPEMAQPDIKNTPDPVHDEQSFDWGMDKEGFSQYDDDGRIELEELYTGTFSSIEEHSIVKGRVVSMNKKDVVIDVGFKSDGLVSRTEFKDRPEMEVGDEVEVYVVETEDSLGQLVLSRKKAQAETSWDNIIKAHEQGLIVTGLIKSRTKGGLVVDLMGMDAFLPGSQIDVKPIRDYDQYVGQKMEFKVVKINEAFKNVVISHKALIEDDIEAQKGEILSRLEKGQVLEGIVKNMTSFGVFIDLGGLDGLLHITDVSWGRINHPEEVLKLDEKINVVVLDFDDDKKRISLGLKQLTPHPWENLSDKLEVGAKVKGKVVTVADYGAFVEIAAGIEGLIHVSEMSWSQHLRNPQDFMNVGDEIQAVILTLEKEEHKMSLGIKQLTPDPWKDIAAKYPVESKHKGIVRNLTNYGLFVELEEGVDGLVHVSDLSWSKKIKHPAEFTKKGEELEVLVLEIDQENRRLSLGHKQLDENPWETFESIFTEGSEHEGTILEVGEKGSTVGLPYGVEGFAPTKHLKREDKTTVKSEDVLAFRIIEFNKDQKRIIVSHTDIWKEQERARMDSEKSAETKSADKASKIVEDMNRGNDVSTLGELDGLAALKVKMEAANRKTAEAKLSKKEEVKDEEVKVETKAPKTKAETKAKAEPAVKAEPKVAPKTKATPKAKSADADDLKKLNGVGPALEKKLIEAGYTTYKQIGALKAKGIAELEAAIGKADMVSKSGWMEQIKELSS